MPSTPTRRARLFRGALLLPLLLCDAPRESLRVSAASGRDARVDSLPERLSDREFWRLSSEMSEPGGFFQSDNFASNELGFAQIAAELRARFEPGGAYLGVGPEQNFSYIAALRPKMAFIVDIRRQAIVQHLMYKAIFELSPDRAAFVSRLFSRPRPAGLDSTTSVDTIIARFLGVPADSTHYRRNYDKLLKHLTTTHGFELSPEDLLSLRFVSDAFFQLGPQISYSGHRSASVIGANAGGATFARLMVTRDQYGDRQSFLATEQNFRIVKDLHTRNLIVPVVGDFAGPGALRAVGAYLTARRATVSAFYVSNVEQYLFRPTDSWRVFYANVTALPTTTESVFIRPSAIGFAPAVVTRERYGVTSPVEVRRAPTDTSARKDTTGAPARAGGAQVCPIASFLRAVNAGAVQSYSDARRCPR